MEYDEVLQFFRFFRFHDKRLLKVRHASQRFEAGLLVVPPWVGNGYQTCVDVANVDISLKRTREMFLFLRFCRKASQSGAVWARDACGGGRRPSTGRRGATGRGLPPADASEKQNSACGHYFRARVAPGPCRLLTAPLCGLRGGSREVGAVPSHGNSFPPHGNRFPWDGKAATRPANGGERP